MNTPRIRKMSRPATRAALYRQQCVPRLHHRLATGAAGVALAAGSIFGLTGCAFDSWLDPSVIGYWEDTPAVAPILDRLDVIEGDDQDRIRTSEVLPEDLIPEFIPYTVGPGDLLTIDIFELFDTNTPYVFQRVIDQTGAITMPQIGSIPVVGLTGMEIQNRIADLLDPAILRNPQISVIVETQQQNTFNVTGQIAQPNRYLIPQPRFLLMDALVLAGGIPETATKIYVIRPIILQDWVTQGIETPRRFQSPDSTGDGPGRLTPEQQRQPDPTPQLEPENLEDLLEELMNLPEKKSDDDQKRDQQPQGLLGIRRSPSGYQPPPTDAQADDQQPGPKPVLNVPSPDSGRRDRQQGDWVYLNGRWVRVTTPPREGGQAARGGDEPIIDFDIEQALIQRVIEIPVKPLLDGDPKYNIVIKPHDTIRLPVPPQGLIYLEGQVSRPGSYDIPATGRLTLTRAIASAGGLGPFAIPERVDIIRIIDRNRQATVRLNLRAIYEMTEPDIYLKPDDRINVGTTWYAAPLAVIRNGFRTTYGFGFLLDRNFGTDVFGAAPDNTNR